MIKEGSTFSWPFELYTFGRLLLHQRKPEVFLFCLLGHTEQCSEFAPGATLRNYFLWAQGKYMGCQEPNLGNRIWASQ